jgi:hypothetical protein
MSAAFDELGLDVCGGRILPPPAGAPAQAPVALALTAELRYFPPGRPLWPGDLQGANLATRRTVLERVGPFDERFGAGTPFRCEDIEWCARAVAAGARAAHVPGIVVHHAHGRAAAAGRELEAGNDRARGAYVVQRLLAGDPAVARAWAAVALGRLGRRPAHVRRAVAIGGREAAGAVAYAARHARAGRTGRGDAGGPGGSGDAARPPRPQVRGADGAAWPGPGGRHLERSRSAAGVPGSTTTA